MKISFKVFNFRNRCLIFTFLLLTSTATFNRGLNAQSDSRIELVTINSPVLGISKSFNIYLPEGYDENMEELYPVVYFFRGHEREWVNRDEDASRNGRNIQDIADLLYENGSIGKMILVMPGLSSTDNSIPGLGVNFVNVNLAGGASGLGTGQFEDYLINDLIPYVDNTYRTIPYGAQRGVDGFSLGGYTSIMLATKHPDLFSSAGAYDGTMMWLDFDDLRSPGPNDDNTWLQTGIFDPAFGSPRDLEIMLQYNPANLIYEANTEKLTLLLNVQFLIHSASSETAGNLVRSQHIVDLLAAQGIENGFEDIRLTSSAQHNWWHADEHALITLPLHWQKFQNPVNTIPLKMITPAAGSEVSGNVEIKWSPGADVENMVTSLLYTRDEGKNWQQLTRVTSQDTTYLWNTEQVPDGTRYLLRAFLVADSAIAVCETEGRFIINNPGNAIPDIEIIFPEPWSLINGEWLVSWFADDADGDSLTFSMDYSLDNGMNWKPLFSNLRHTNEYLWNTNLFANSPNYLLTLYCSDNSVETIDTSEVFEVFNEREIILPQQIFHVQGYGSAKIFPYIVDANQLTGDIYRITFNDTLFGYKVYDVLNINTGENVVTNATQLDGVTEGPLFDGLRLVIDDYNQAEINHDSTGWIVGSSTLDISIYLPQIDLGTEVLYGFPHPADYKITIYDYVVDTSSSAFGAQEVPMKFTVWNLTENKNTDIIFIDLDENSTISRLDEIYLLEPDEFNELRLTWTLFFSGLESVTLPVSGDEFVFRTLKPVTSEDVYEFSATSVAVDDQKESKPAQFVLFQNYPNPFNPITKIQYKLPQKTFVILKVYNMMGQEVKNLVNNNQIAGHHRVEWDGIDDYGNFVSSGIYFYKIEAGGFVQIKKMLLMK